ncbi:AraC family transcriptional regulator [uncultured Croceitalea sp.]|uniref:AraC family transcriptional regulator n=1 Tax=uncultured Croceitalea sp. TaxID=1798908 RepID=UPI003305EB37
MKAYPFKIVKKPQENIVLQEDKVFTFFDKLHYHQEIQISFIVKGEGKLIVGNTIHTYKAEDIVVIGSNIPHLFQSKRKDSKSHMISIFFSHNAFGDDFFDIPEMQETKAFFDKIKYGIALNAQNKDWKNQFLQLHNTNKFELFIAFLNILKNLSKASVKLLSNQVYKKSLSTHQGERLQLIFDYVMNNFQNDIKLSTVANMVHMSPNAFCRFFKQRSNKSFFTFITEVRVAHACQLLIENEDSYITEIAQESGFSTISNFNKHFKAIKGLSPTQYQKSMILS